MSRRPEAPSAPRTAISRSRDGGAGEHQVGHIGAGNEKNEADRAEEKQEARTHGSGFGFEKRHDGHVRGPAVGHLPGKLMHEDAAEAAQLGLRLRGRDAGSKPAEGCAGRTHSTDRGSSARL